MVKSESLSENSSTEKIGDLPSSITSKSQNSSSQFRSAASFGTTQQLFSDVGYYRGVLVSIKHIKKEHVQLSRAVLLEFNQVLCYKSS